mmetsp:Transcript_43320/g.99835  ORF Transcript_43320/g.99835 Transcript_43320/m.99835 type:complete len:318 (-) Transcript_43320:49-1002(-)
MGWTCIARAGRRQGWTPCVLAVSTLSVMLLSSSGASFLHAPHEQRRHAKEVIPTNARAVSKVQFEDPSSMQGAGQPTNTVAALLLCTVAAAAIGRLHVPSRSENPSRAKRCRVQLAAMPSLGMTVPSASGRAPSPVQAEEPAISSEKVIIQTASHVSIPTFLMDVPAVAPTASTLPAPLVASTSWSRPRGKPQVCRRVAGVRKSQRSRSATARQAQAQERAQRRSVGSRLSTQEQPVYTPEVTPSFDASRIRCPIQAGIRLSMRSGVRSTHERRRRRSGTSSSACDSMLALTSTSCLRIEAPKDRHNLHDIINLSSS